MNLIDYLKRQIEWSGRTFGYSPRAVGITRHIERELIEIRAAPRDLTEWVDVVILALDGAWRAGYTAEQIADALGMKQADNMVRDWPPVGSCKDDEPTEHIRVPNNSITGAR